MTQDEFADAIGAKKRGFQDNESGKTIPRSDVIQGIIKLGVNANWLLTGEGEMMLNSIDEDNNYAIIDATAQQIRMIKSVIDLNEHTSAERDEKAIDRVQQIIEFRNLMRKGLSHLNKDQAKLWDAVLHDLIQRHVVTKDDVLALLNTTKN